jgi:quercetin dioxygenase-like cupin family protein
MKLAHFDEVALEPVYAEGSAGTMIRWLVSQKDGAPHFALRMFEVEPGGNTPYHTHNWEHEVYCLQGEGHLVTEAGAQPFKQDDFIYVDPNMMHQFKNVGSGIMKFLCIIPHEELVKKEETAKLKPKQVNPFGSGKANNC